MSKDNSEEQTDGKDKESLWGEEQTSKLIEGLSMFGDDWNEIAEHVGNTLNKKSILKGKLQYLKQSI